MTAEGDDLYYYCALRTFLSVVQNGSFWLSDMRKSNDSSEIRWAFEGLRTDASVSLMIIGAKEKNEKFEFASLLGAPGRDISSYASWDFRKLPNDFLIDPLGGISRYKQVATELNGADEQFGGPLPRMLWGLASAERRNTCNRCYAMCMSEKKDSLGQWRGYSDNGSGVCLGLKKSFFERLVDECSLDYLMFDKVRYGRPRLDDFIVSGDRYFKEMDNAHRLRRMSPFYKNDSFFEESEWRFLIWLEDHSAMDDLLRVGEKSSCLSDAPTLRFSDREGDLVPHLELRPKQSTEIIDSVMLGPKCSANVEDVRLLFASLGIGSEVEVEVSDSSYC